MTSMLGIGPRPIAIGRTRISLAVAGAFCAALLFIVSGSVHAQAIASFGVELIAAALIATLIYEPLQRIRVPVRRAPTIGAWARLSGIAIIFLGVNGVRFEPVTLAAQFVLMTLIVALGLGCIFVADRMQTIEKAYR